MDTESNLSLTNNLWNKDPGLKRAAELMKRISDSADRHRQIIADRKLRENTMKTNGQHNENP